MKFGTLVFTLLCGAAVAAAQNPYLAPVGVSERDGRIVVDEPRSPVAVDLQVEHEQILCGPYARYAQKLLGVRAPLTDKNNYRIAGASIALAAGDDFLYAGDVPAADTRMLNHAGSAEAFGKVQIDKTDLLVAPQESAAMEAAKTIFSLRKHRLELITGEAGENVFGEGLRAALEEIDRLEQSYLELFLGKQITTLSTVRFVVRLQPDRTLYTVCRLDPAEGVAAESATTGTAVQLKITPSGDTACELELSAKEKGPSIPFRAADPSLCVVTCGDRTLGRATLPLFEFGRTVQLPQPR